MTGEKQFPDDLGGAIYISLPASQGESECWNYLGHISNTKTSDTFKIDNLKRMGIDNMTTNNFGNFTGPRIGISVKTLTEIQGLTPGIISSMDHIIWKKFNVLFSDFSRYIKCSEKYRRKSFQLCFIIQRRLEKHSNLDNRNVVPKYSVQISPKSLLL